MDKDLILQKALCLKTVEMDLKNEFVGIDSQISEVMELISPWYQFPEGQRRPTIVLLIGMTGTGKTTLVRGISEKLNIPMIEIDAGAMLSEDYGFSYLMYNKFSDLSGKQCIVLLDDIHTARTINEKEEELDRPSIRGIWSILSDGVLKIEWRMNIADEFRKLHRKLSARKAATELEIAKGKYDLLEIDVDATADYKYAEDAREWTIFRSDLKNVCSLLNKDYNWIEQISENIKSNYEFTIRNLIEELEKSDTQVCLDFSKSIIFIAGNLDEVYTGALNMNPDITADELNKESLKISVPKIKSALLKRFRSEQIARLGNNYIIYPTFTTNNYKDIIRLELDKISKFFTNIFEERVSIKFNENIINKIYKEGVFPTQGTRCINSTISSMIDPVVYNLSLEIIKNIKIIDDIEFEIDIENNYFIVDNDFINIKYPVKNKISKLRELKYDSNSISIAIHEAGHTLAILLGGKCPVKVSSHVAGPNALGFSEISNSDITNNKQELINDLIVGVSGWAAENIILGEDQVRDVSSQDLYNVSLLAHRIISKYGMGDNLGYFYYRMGSQSMNETLELKERQKEEIYLLIENCKNSAFKIINQHKKFILELASELIQNESLYTLDILRIANNNDIRLFSEDKTVDIFEKVLKDYNLPLIKLEGDDDAKINY